MRLLKGARPVINEEVRDHYQTYNFKQVELNEYTDTFYEWIIAPSNKTIDGLDEFNYRYYIQGTSQGFDNFVLRHATKQIVNFAGDFQYHACISKYINHKVLTSVTELTSNQALIISFPFSDTGVEHSSFVEILTACNQLNIPVCLDIAYWGIAKDLTLDLARWSCIQEVVCSLSKPFYVLETHRVGIRFSREYVDDGICMLNEVGMNNNYSMSLGCWFMQRFSNSYNWDRYSQTYYQVCDELELTPTDTVIFALGDRRHSEYNRGLPGNNRVCISEYLKGMKC